MAAFEPDQEVLLIGATREAVDDFVRGLTQRTNATFGLHRFTLVQLAARIAAEHMAMMGCAPATTLGTEALATRCAYEAMRGSALSYFAPVSSFPGFARTLARTCAELRLAAVASTAVQALGGPGVDLADLLTRFAAALEASRTVDRAELFRVATRIVLSGDSPLPLDLPVVLLDAEVATPVEGDLVLALAGKSPAVLVTLPAGDQRTASALRKLNAEAIEQPAARDPDPSGLARLRQYLFSSQELSDAQLDESVHFFSAPGEGREAIEIARYVLDEARAGIPFDEIAVFLRMPETYSAALQTAFGRAGVPAYFARGTKRPDPAGRAFLALLDCAADGLSAKRFATYLSFGEIPRLDATGQVSAAGQGWSGSADEMVGPAARAAHEADETAPAPLEQAPVVDGEGWTGAAPWRWEELIVEASVIGSHERWQRRLTGLENELRLKIEESASDDPESAMLRRLTRQLAEIGYLKRFALPVIEMLAALPRTASWGDWLHALAALAPATLRRPERVLRVLAELEPMAAVGPVAIDEVTNVLNERLSFLEEDPPASRYGRVFVASPEHARGRSFAVVFVPGLAERIFPQRPREDPLLLDAQRAALTPDLATKTQRGQGERLILRLAVGAARERIYFSYPRVDVVEARPRVTSFYGLDVMRATQGRIPDIDQFEQETAAKANARLAWPAPSDATRAIDPVEHDLSTLHQLFHEARADERKGRARYLFDLNDHLARSLRGRYARWERPQWSELDGIVRVTPATADALASHRLTARPYSPSALEKFAACPYRFLLAAIHRLEPRREVASAEQIDPLTRGRLLHQVQAEALRALLDGGLLPLRDDTMEQAEAVLIAVLARVADAYRDQLAPPILRVWQDEIDALRVDLVAWLRHVAADTDWQPRYFELGFGLPPDRARDPASTAEAAVVAGGARLRGSVDLVEVATAGGANRVTDHKTGLDRTRPGMVVGNGETLQPVLYAFAIEAAMGTPVREARLFFCTNRGGFAQRVVPIDDAARTAGRRVLEIIDRAVEAGVLPPAPRRDACTYCDFRLVCGPHEEERLRRKDRNLLRDLDALRLMP